METFTQSYARPTLFVPYAFAAYDDDDDDASSAKKEEKKMLLITVQYE